MNGASAFSRAARERTAPRWDAVLGHPFLLGLADGSLPEEAFRRYMVQDYLFLVEYARVMALAAAKARDLDSMGRLAELLHATLNQEMQLHRDFCSRVGIGLAELEQSPMLPGCHAYTSHLLAVAWGESAAVLAASLLPCQLGYAEIAAHLARRGRSPVPAYQEWVDAYASDDYVRLALWLGQHADALFVSAGSAERRHMEEVYLESLRLEHGFWDMAWGESHG